MTTASLSATRSRPSCAAAGARACVQTATQGGRCIAGSEHGDAKSLRHGLLVFDVAVVVLTLTGHRRNAVCCHRTGSITLDWNINAAYEEGKQIKRGNNTHY